MVGLLPSSHVGLESAIGVFYTYVHLKSVAEQHKNEFLYNKVSTMLDKHSKKLANTIFDYCAITTYGEARHGIDKANKYFSPHPSPIENREASYREAIQYNPYSFLFLLEKYFNSTEWSESTFGGKLWGNIAKVTLKKNIN